MQIADVLQDAVGLPPWVSGLAVLLLLIVLIIILSTACVQSFPSTTDREEAGEIPTDRKIAPSDVLESLRSFAGAVAAYERAVELDSLSPLAPALQDRESWSWYGDSRRSGHPTTSASRRTARFWWPR